MKNTSQNIRNDPRIARLDWTLDPLAPKYPELTPYQFSSNRVLDGVELEGLEVHTLNDDQELPNFDEAYKYNVGETFITPSGNFYENKEWHKGFHYKGFEDVTEDYTATINCNCPKEPSKFSKAVDDFRKWENKYFGEGNDDPANTGNNYAGKQAPGIVKAIVELNPLIGAPNGFRSTFFGKDIYGEKVEGADRVWSGITLIPFTKPIIKYSVKTLDFIKSSTEFSIDEYNSLDKTKSEEDENK